MRKIITVFLISLLLLLVFFPVGCGKDEKTNCFTDQIGRIVEIKETPKRIVSGYYISTSVCIALGLSDKLVGIETGKEVRPIYSLIKNETISKAVDVGSAKNFDLEKCCSANPDLVILPYKAKNSATILDELGIPSIVVFPETQDGFIEMVNLIAEITDTENRAKNLLDYYKEKTAFISEKVGSIIEVDKPKVFMGSASGYLTTSPKDMYQSFVINLCGGKNCGDIFGGNNKVDVSKEQFLSMNPDVIIIPTNSNANGYVYDKNTYSTDKALSSVNAVKNGKIYYMPKGFESWDSPTPSSILGALYVLHLLYPDLFCLEDFKDEVFSFYKTFYNITIDKDVIVNYD